MTAILLLFALLASAQSALPSKAPSPTQPKVWTAHWITSPPPSTPATKTQPLPIFRHAFSLNKPVKKASLSISGLGQYEAHINGLNVTHDLLTPGWTNYRKRIFYNTYDVTALLHPGPNALGVLLGNGMFNIQDTPGRYMKITGSFGQPQLIAQLTLLFADGTRQTIASNSSWKTAPGPITFSSTYGGEDFDARLQPPTWDTPAFDDSTWQPALETPGPGGTLVLETAPAIRAFDTFTPVKVISPKPTVTVYDLGQNFAGLPSIAATGPAGATITLLAGELLDASHGPAGLVSQRSANASAKDPVLFTYTLRGDSTPERWTPRFTYYGFRYIQATVSSPAVSISSVSGLSIHAAAPVIGHFSATGSTTGDLFNRIHALIDKAILSNMVSVLTDCPHREKLGWLEQTHLMGASIMANYDVSGLYRKMQDDMDDDQHPDGNVPTVAPDYAHFPDDFGDTPEWGSAVILSPWTAFQSYGNLATLRDHYPAMQHYVEYLRTRAGERSNPPHIITYGLGDWYDIGPGEPGRSKLTSPGITATAIFYQDLTTLARIAALMQHPADATAYTTEAASVKAAFNAQFFHPDTNQYDKGSQTANAMPLALGLVPAGHESAVLANLVAAIRANGNHVTAGDVGFHYVVRALTDLNRSDVLYDMVALTTNPSYGYQLAQGATTLTEAWDANPRSSQNHFMLGHAEEWFYRGLAGIDLDLSRTSSQHDDRIHIHPAVVGDLTSVTATLTSPLGLIASNWSRTSSTLTLDIAVPTDATATFTLPPNYSHNLTQNGRPVTHDPRIHPTNPSSTTYVLAAGKYHLQSTSE